jgi:putative hemolysin
MKNRIDPLIAERAPWLYQSGPASRVAKRILDRLLGYEKTLELAQSIAHTPHDWLMHEMGMRLAKNVTVSGLSHIPKHGPALIVANHPTGIADGIVLHSVVAKVRPDIYFLANRDILRVLPQLAAMIAPVEWRKSHQSISKTRQTVAYLQKATAQERLGVVFPSGRLAKRRGMKLVERDWVASAATLARKLDVPVIPVNIQARNSALFYLFDFIHPTLRDITLFHETLNKDRQPFKIKIGEAISASAIPSNPEAGIAMLRRATLDLGGTVDLLKASSFRAQPTLQESGR